MQIKTKIVSCRTADSKPVKQEVNGTVILPPLVFPAPCVSEEQKEIFDKILKPDFVIRAGDSVRPDPGKSGPGAELHLPGVRVIVRAPGLERRLLLVMEVRLKI